MSDERPTIFTKDPLAQPTQEKLTSDAVKVAEQVHQFWQGDVEVLVIIAERGKGPMGMGSTFQSTERLKAMLDIARSKAHRLVSLTGRVLK